MKPHYYGHRERLKKKFIENGIEALNEYEVIELLLFFSIPVKDTKPIAKELLKEFKNIKGIFKNLDSKKILNVKGFGKNSLTLFKLIKELHSLIEKQKIFERKVLDNLEKVIKYAKVSIGNRLKEELKVICLNSKNEIIEDVTVEIGTENEIYIYPRKIVKIALENNSTAIILLHNHPSGNINPSQSDINITKKLKLLLENIGITLHDHIIVASDNYFSFKEQGII